ncbi:4-alpha-glucanotransferase [Burkholderiales bacterium 8X]|nr:4-alpha-glucanotransferase [Burkholderiales bacterium 8X]
MALYSNHGDIEALHRLCAHFGIKPDYQDIWGTHHPVAPEGLVALLGEFGVKLDEAHGPQVALAASEEEAWRRALPPVIATRSSDGGWHLPLRLSEAGGSLQWKVECEDGSSHAGTVDLQSAPEVSRRIVDGQAWSERKPWIGLQLPAGYHRLRIDGLDGETLLIVAPDRCYRPPATQDGAKVWGPAVQLYALRSGRNWGIGDFTDLSQLVGLMAERGADIVGLNPLHALFPHNPAHASPYSPSSRQQLNVLYIDVEAIDEFEHCEPARRLVRSPEFQARLAQLRSAELVDYVGVAAAKFEVLELLFAHFQERHLSGEGGSAVDALGRRFEDFVVQGGESLRRHALYEALQAHLHAEDSSIWGWQVWPEGFRQPESAAVQAFGREHADRVRFYQYLQWQAARQLGLAAERCKVVGMGVGLYVDVAVSVDRAGSDAWSAQECFASEASVGAPPDEFNPNGQGWGLPPLRPDRLRETHYRFFVDTLRANMSGAGAVRIDHVMGLMRLFWIPPGQTARDGAYVHYAVQEMLSIVALESQRNRCMVIGEDLGTVADEMRKALTDFDVLSYRLFYFERRPDGGFIAPQDYPPAALVSVSTHDLATLHGWWASRDLHLRLELGLFPNAEVFEKQLLDRAQERVRLLFALQQAGLLTALEVAEEAGGQVLSARAVRAVHAFLASAPSAVMMVQMEDLLGVVEQANMPATTDEQPNWKRKLPVELGQLANNEVLESVSEVLATARPRTTLAIAERQGPQTLVPRATYRIQFHKDFGFDDAIRILPYLAELGVSHVYCSPIQRARPGSMHGYDVIAHDEVNPELGGQEGFERFSAALREHGMGQLLDMVPNHMGVLGADNKWWMDVLENGPASLYAQHFDIDWHPLNEELTGKVLLPVLGDHYGDVLNDGDIVLHFEPESGSLALRYFDHRFPLAPESYAGVLSRAESRLDDLDLAAYLGSIASAFGHLPVRDTADAQARSERARDKELLKARLARLVSRQPAVAQAVSSAVAELNLDTARDALHALIENQAYRLAYWRVAADEINYRRFFDINELAALRMENKEVFEATQGFALDLAAKGIVDGLRIDHPDGLYDPASYFRDLQQGYARRAGKVLPERDAEGRPARPLYVVAEKIAAPHEEVPEDWHIHGTTGYRFANVANGVLVDTTASGRFQSIWRNFTGVAESFEALARVGKRDIIRSALSSELNVLSTELLRIARADRRTRDYTLNSLRRALAEVAACMPVYRTYIIDSASPQDERFVDWATEDAEHHSDDADLSVFGFVRKTLLGQSVPDAPPALAARVRRLAIRFQQFSAPVAAKGVEDTAFYRYFPLSSLNEVGGEPAIFGMTVEEFHTASADRAKRWPHTMLATSTHDNKRSEDVRNRIDVLSEMPATWRLALRRWRAMNHPVRQRFEAEGRSAEFPSHADEYLLYQTLLGTLPPDGLTPDALEAWRERIKTYMQKAVRESKVHTRWTHPNEAYESALADFIDALLARLDANPFLDDLQALGRRLTWFGALNSLTLMLLKYASPGVPDLYQGNELMDLSLVDPDNRRPVDYDKRMSFLQEMKGVLEGSDIQKAVRHMADAPYDGRAKLWIMWRLLALRSSEPAVFRDGDYNGLDARGDKAAHVIAFSRTHARGSLVVIGGRLFSCLAGNTVSDGDHHELPVGAAWGDTRVQTPALADGTVLESLFTGERLTVSEGGVALSDAMRFFPAAALWVRSQTEG